MTTTTTDYKCPAWCERTDHGVDDPSDGSAPYHYAPDFGAIEIQAEGDGPFEIWIHDTKFADAAGLEKHRADALAAAEWLEAHA